MNTLDPATIKRDSWLARRAKLDGLRLRVWQGLALAKCNLGRAVTTRELARLLGLSILAVRPRVTELVDLGFARCTGKQGHEGTYESVGLKEAQSALDAQLAGRSQPLLPL